MYVYMYVYIRHIYTYIYIYMDIDIDLDIDVDIDMLFIEKRNNKLITIFRLLPLSIHVNIYNLSIVHKIM